MSIDEFWKPYVLGWVYVYLICIFKNKKGELTNWQFDWGGRL